MYNKKLIVFFLLILISFPLISKKKKESIQTYIEKTNVSKKKITLLSILKRDKVLALNYVKVRERILKNSKKRKFHMIFRASIKHILEETKQTANFSLNKSFIENKRIGDSRFRFKNIKGVSFVSLSFLNFKKSFLNSTLNFTNIMGPGRIGENYISLNSKFDLGLFNIKLRGFRALNQRKQYFYDSAFSLYLSNIKARLSFWKGKGNIVKGNLMFYGNDLPYFGENFFLEKSEREYLFKISQNYYNFEKSYSLNSLSLIFGVRKKFLETYLGGGLIRAYTKMENLKDYFFLNFLVKKRFFNKTIIINFPHIFSTTNDYLKFLSFNYSPSFKFFTFVSPLSSEFFVGVYYNLFDKNKRFLYQFGFRKHYNL